MSHIKNIEIKNFKSIRHAKIEDCRRVNVFIGYPNVGKSNILEALSGLVYSHDPTPNFKTLCRYESHGDLIFNGNTQSDNSAQVTLNDYSVLEYKYVGQNKININVKDYKNLRDANIISIANVDSLVNDIFSVYIEDGEPSLYDLIGNDLPVIKKYEFDKSKNKYSPTQNNGLNIPFGENLSDILESNHSIRKEVAELFKDYNLKILLEKGGATMRVVKTLDEETIFSIPFYYIADTLQRIILYKTAVLSNNNSVLLLEEPEAHMFPPYIAKLTADINLDKNNNQFFITTHSPFVLNDLMEDLDKEDLAIYTVGYKNETGETIIKKITDSEIAEIYQYGIDLFFNLENYLKDAN